MKNLNAICLAFTASLLLGCAGGFSSFVDSEPQPLAAEFAAVTKIVRAAAISLPEAVASGDLTPADATKFGEALEKAQAKLEAAQDLITKGFDIRALDQYDTAIEVLRTVKDQVESEQAKQNIGRLLFAITFKRALSE